MKKLIVLIVATAVLMSSFVGCVGLSPAPEQEISRIVVVENVTKEVIFEKTKIWIAENFNSSKAVLEYTNKEDGVIIGNGKLIMDGNTMDLLAGIVYRCYFTMRVDIKDSRFKISFLNLKVTSSSNTYGESDGYPPTNNHMNKVKPKLLGYGDSIKALIIEERTEADW